MKKIIMYILGIVFTVSVFVTLSMFALHQLAVGGI